MVRADHDYDVGINYHPGKANVVADALSRKKHCNAMAAQELPELCKEFEELILVFLNELVVVTMEVNSTLEADIQKGQLEDAKIQEIKQLIKSNKTCESSEDEQGTLWQGKRICVPDVKEIRELIHREAHDSAYSIHLGCTKMY
jgi:HPt (histidine-containing phosphotransfer) domain-containing protein